MHPVAEALNKISAELKSSFFERDTVIDAMVLALLAGEHICILGEPGTSKSLLVRYLVGAIEDKTYFEVLLSKTRPAERVLGPLNIKEFRDNGNYFLKRKGFATDADLIFLDEIGKMSPVLGHDLLALLNERVYHEVNGGHSVQPAPLHTAFTASNELPTRESDDAEALWDRLLVRVWVDYLQNKQNFAKLLTADIAPPVTRISFDDLKKATEVEIPAIGVSKLALVAMVNLRTKMATHKLFASDRRWRASVKILQAAAFMDGSVEVEERHLLALQHTLWNEIEDIEAIRGLCGSVANPFHDDVDKQRKLLAEVDKGLRTRSDDEAALRAYAPEVGVKLKQVRSSLDTILLGANGREIPDFAVVAEKHRALLIEMFIQCMDQDPEEAEKGAEKRLGLGNGIK